MAKGGGGINIVLSADAEALKKGLAEAKAALSKTADSAIADQQRMAKAADKFTKDAANAGTLRAQNRALFNLAASYESMGEAGSKAFRETLKQAGAAKDRMGDLQMMVEAGHMEGKVKVFAGALQNSIGIIAGAEGAMHMLGIKTEAATAVTAKLQSLMVMSQGIGSIIALRDQMQALTATSATFAGVMKVVQAALMPGPLLLIAGAATALYLIFEKTPAKIVKVNQSLETMKGIQETLTKTTQETMGRFRMLTDVLQSNASSVDAKRAAFEKLQELYPKYFKNLDFDKSKNEDIAAAIRMATTELKNKAMAQAIEQRMTELANEQIKKEIDLRQKQAQHNKFNAKQGEREWYAQKQAIASLAGEILKIQADRAELVKIAGEVGKEFATAIDEIDVPKIEKKATPKVKVQGVELIGMETSMQSAVNATMQQVQFDVKWGDVGKKAMTSGPNGMSPIFGQTANQMIKQTEHILMKSQEAHDDFLRKQRSRRSFIGPAPQLAPVEIAPVNLQQMQENQRQLEKYLKNKERIYNQEQAQINAMNQGIQQALSSGLDSFEQFVVDMTLNDENAGKNFGRALLGAVAGFMSSLGKAMVAAGLASETFQKALLTNPALAIGAGAALIIAAGIVKGKMAKAMGANEGGGGGNNSGGPEGIRRFASGGIISGPTIGMMGEYPGAKSNPEVVAPLDKLKNIIGTSGGGGGELVTRISGQDLLIMLDRAETNRGRVR